MGDHPDDIQAWIAERKRRFPTRENIAKKMDRRKRCRDEGAVAIAGEEKKRKYIGGEIDQKVKDVGVEDGCLVVKKMEEERVTEKETKGSELPLNSIASLMEGYGSFSSDEEVDKTITLKRDGDDDDANIESKSGDLNNHNESMDTLSATATISQPLNSHDETRPSSNCESKQPEQRHQDSSSKYKTKQCRYFLRNGTCKNGDGCTYIHDLEQHEAYKSNLDVRKERQSQRDRARNESKKETNLNKSGRQQGGMLKYTDCDGTGAQSLLRKLLENDIRRERSLCLQLLRYIVDCNFLQDQRDVQGDGNEKETGI